MTEVEAQLPEQPEAPLVSVVIPCYNPTEMLREALASVWEQTYRPLEVILVNDGADSVEGRRLLRSLAGQVTRYIEQPNQGLSAARNTGFRTAEGPHVLPLDADDRLKPTAIAACVQALEAHPEAAFVYPDYEVFGDTRYVERLPEYNLFRLLDENILIYASLIRRADWEEAGGYDESMRLGYEDWDFWLRLAERERFGHHLGQVLFEYRKHGRTMLTEAREHHQELVARIRQNHPGLYGWPARARIKARWAPSVCVLGAELDAEQTIEDWERLPTTDVHQALEQSRAEAFLLPGPAPADPHSVEWCALAVWGGRSNLHLPDGSTAVARGELGKAERRPAAPPPSAQARPLPLAMERLHRHLVNAELNSLDAWLRHPGRSLVRLIPLRLKERINRAAGRPVFDLSFYLRFQPRSLLAADSVTEALQYLPRPASRPRLALVTPQLGPGGAESVLLELARAVDRSQYELFVIATQSQEAGWRTRWEKAADHVYDLAALVEPQRLVAALYSLAFNWEFRALILQNSLYGYSALAPIRRALPEIRIADLVHAVGQGWDFVSATAEAAGAIDLRVTISEAGRERLRQAGTPEERIRLIRNGIDVEGFAGASGGDRTPRTILFAGRLDPVKRPALLADIAAELARRRPAKDFRFVVAGDGPEAALLRARLRKRRVAPLFDLLGQVEEMAPLLARADVVVVPSEQEGIPLIALEAMAAGRPVVCARAGAAGEAVGDDTGVLVDPGPGEAARFAEALAALLDDPQRRRSLGAAGRRKVEAQYSRRQAQEAYRTLIRELLGQT